MKIHKQDKRDAKQLFRACLVNGRMDEQRVRGLVQALVTQKPRSYLPILQHLHRLVQFELARRTATVESAIALPDALRRGVEERLHRAYGEALLIRFRENPSLLGGLRVQVGSDVYDGTVQSRLERLQEAF